LRDKDSGLFLELPNAREHLAAPSLGVPQLLHEIVVVVRDYNDRRLGRRAKELVKSTDRAPKELVVRRVGAEGRGDESVGRGVGGASWTCLSEGPSVCVRIVEPGGDSGDADGLDEDLGDFGDGAVACRVRSEERGRDVRGAAKELGEDRGVWSSRALDVQDDRRSTECPVPESGLYCSLAKGRDVQKMKHTKSKTTV
jgi:hypothetical protein